MITVQIPPKPRSAALRSELTRLPRLTRRRKLLRWILRGIARLLVAVTMKAEVTGLELFPPTGPALVVINHLGDADALLGLSFLPRPVEALAKLELYDLRILGKLLDRFGVIWVHRGNPDRNAIRAALEAFSQGRVVGLAPEGRQSLTGGLEGGTGGAAYLALKADVPIVPVALTHTENNRVYGNLKRFRRTHVTMQVGAPFRLDQNGGLRRAVRDGTELIMHRLAALLPEAYRGVYQDGSSKHRTEAESDQRV